MIITFATITLAGIQAYAALAGFAVASAVVIPRVASFVREKSQNFKFPKIPWGKREKATA